MSNGEVASGDDVASEAGNMALVNRPSPEAILSAFFLEQRSAHVVFMNDKTMAAIREALAGMSQHKSSKGAMLPHANSLVFGYIPKVLPKKWEPLNSLPLRTYVHMDTCVQELIKKLRRMSTAPRDEAGIYAYTLALALSDKRKGAMQIYKELYTAQGEGRAGRYPEYYRAKPMFESVQAFISLQSASLNLEKARLCWSEQCMKNREVRKSEIIASMSVPHMSFAVHELERAQLLCEFSV